MSDIKALGDRIDALETRLTFQDETIETLNKTITAQWQQIDALSRQLANLAERLQATGVSVTSLARGVPVGAGGSRLLRGNHPEHELLEEEAARAG